MFYKKGFVKNFTKFTGKHLCQGLFFDKVVSLRPVTLLKKRLWHRCFLVNFAIFLRAPIFIEHLWWLLLEYPSNYLHVDHHLFLSCSYHKIKFPCSHPLLFLHSLLSFPKKKGKERPVR